MPPRGGRRGGEGEGRRGEGEGGKEDLENGFFRDAIGFFPPPSPPPLVFKVFVSSDGLEVWNRSSKKERKKIMEERGEKKIRNIYFFFLRE